MTIRDLRTELEMLGEEVLDMEINISCDGVFPISQVVREYDEFYLEADEENEVYATQAELDKLK